MITSILYSNTLHTSTPMLKQTIIDDRPRNNMTHSKIHYWWPMMSWQNQDVSFSTTPVIPSCIIHDFACCFMDARSKMATHVPVKHAVRISSNGVCRQDLTAHTEIILLFNLKLPWTKSPAPLEPCSGCELRLNWWFITGWCVKRTPWMSFQRKGQVVGRDDPEFCHVLLPWANESRKEDIISLMLDSWQLPQGGVRLQLTCSWVGLLIYTDTISNSQS